MEYCENRRYGMSEMYIMLCGIVGKTHALFSSECVEIIATVSNDKNNYTEDKIIHLSF